MARSCDLHVDVNGEEVFMVDKGILSSFSGRLSKLFNKSTGSTQNFKVIFHDFPGGAESFELMTRFCYNNGRIEITPTNISLLHSVAHFMEMKNSEITQHNLIEQTEKSIEEMSYWTWAELLIALKQCQEVPNVWSSTSILKKCVDSMVGRLVLSNELSPCPSTSSPDSSAIRFSCDTRSTESLKHSFSRGTWWFEDLLVLNFDVLEMVIKSMASRKFDHGVISRFLFYYQKSKFATAKSEEKCKIMENVINMLCFLDRRSVSCKSLFGILRVSINLNISKSCRSNLEAMIGAQIDQATLDNLLIPSPCGYNYLYDVNLVLRFLKSFLGDGISHVSSIRLKKVARLIDSYIAEVAPDPCLRPSKLLGLIAALPDSARDSYDEIYYAMDMYLEVHGGLSDEEKLKISCALNYGKLSSGACIHLAHNPKFPSKSAVQALVSQQSKLKSLLHDTNYPKSIIDSPDIKNKGKQDEPIDQIVIYAGKLNLSNENEKLRAHLQGMQWRVTELEKICSKMQTQMTKMMKSRLSKHSSSRSLPKLCS